nr:hypothetical protein [Tanacetum cinerariifolium]
MLTPSGGGLFLYQAYGNLYAMTVAGDGVASIKRRCRDQSRDDVRIMDMASGYGRLKEDLESSTWRRPNSFGVSGMVIAEPRVRATTWLAAHMGSSSIGIGFFKVQLMAQQVQNWRHVYASKKVMISIQVQFAKKLYGDFGKDSVTTVFVLHHQLAAIEFGFGIEFDSGGDKVEVLMVL